MSLGSNNSDAYIFFEISEIRFGAQAIQENNIEEITPPRPLPVHGRINLICHVKKHILVKGLSRETLKPSL